MLGNESMALEQSPRGAQDSGATQRLSTPLDAQPHDSAWMGNRELVVKGRGEAPGH